MRWIILVTVLGGCLRTTSFTCTDDPSCGASGTCESTGYCSVPDPMCDGNRYVDSAGPYAGQCVGVIPPTDDARVDVPTSDTTIDATDALSTCPGFAPYPSVPNGHVYKKLVATDDWNHARDMCFAETGNSYLAIPDDLNELNFLDVDAAGVDAWIGIHRQGSSANFNTVFGVAPTILPWMGGQPDNANGKDCVRIVNAGEIQTDSCGTHRVIICECIP